MIGAICNGSCAYRLGATAQSRVVRYCLTLPELDKTLLMEAATFVRHADGAGWVLR
jgi:hypothetical protein